MLENGAEVPTRDILEVSATQFQYVSCPHHVWLREALCDMIHSSYHHTRMSSRLVHGNDVASGRSASPCRVGGAMQF